MKMPKRPLRIYAVELFMPKSWRLAMSVEMCANVYPRRHLADAAAARYRRHGHKTRVVSYFREVSR